MCIGEKCNKFISLSSHGVPDEGHIGDTEWLNRIHIPCSNSIINPNMYINTPSKGLHYIKNMAHGSFGYIDIAERTVGNEKRRVFVKRPIIPGKSLLKEACIQKIVIESLEKGGFPTGAPRMLDIFRLSDNSVCFSMDILKDTITLQEYLSKLGDDELTGFIIDCIIQLCAMLWWLHEDIGMNHRDLKPSNILIRKHAAITKNLKIGDVSLNIMSSFSVSFIDFGFSCIGNEKNQVSDLAIGSIYSANDPCPKDGRDIYYFIASLYAELYKRLSKDIIMLFETWLAIPGSNLLSILRKHGTNAQEWIYYLTGNIAIRQFTLCCPVNIVKDLRAL
jgi:serine/threonine protein kinase